MRLFVAVEIPAELRKEFASLIEELRAAAGDPRESGPRWVRAENFHLTLKFIGEVVPAKVPLICSALAGLSSSQPLALEFRGLGFFPNEKNARVLWAGISDSSRLQALAVNVERALEHLGIPREQRAFHPHLTLARIAPPEPHSGLRAAIGRNAERVFGSLHAREFHLIESQLKSSGAEYTTLHSFPLAEAEA